MPLPSAESNLAASRAILIAICYAAGAAGSVLPLALYQRSDWTVFLVATRLVVASAGGPLLALAQRPAR